jgi:hypothetical protein
MSWKALQTKDLAYPFMRRRDGALNGRRLLRGAARGRSSMSRGPRLQRSRSFFCCCPVFFVLGLAGLAMIAGSLYLGIQYLGWA